MLIGFDFDNTIACYERAITRLADETFTLPDDVPRTKIGLRDYLRQENRESDWTAFQGALYGPGMRYAEPFEGAIETMTQLRDSGHKMVIVSHRSRTPYAGPQYDLHKTAHEWMESHLKTNNLFEDNQVYFLESKNAKIATIGLLGCEVFVDDLPEILDSPNFPKDTVGILFTSMADIKHKVGKRLTISQWCELPKLLS